MKAVSEKKTVIARDRELVERLLRGDERAFREFYRTYSPPLLNRLMKWLGDADLAEDCLQQVFIKALQTLKNYRGEGSLKSWLNGIATNLVLEKFRRQKRFSSLLEKLSSAKELKKKEEAFSDQFLWNKELREILYSCLETLSPEKRMSIILCDIEGLSIEEAAQQMGVPMGTVGSRLYNARRELRRKLERKLRQAGLSVEELIR